MSEVDITAEEMFESLNGFDELAIAKWFDASPLELGGTTLGRSLVFVVKRREGMTDVEAHAAAMSLAIRDLTGFFVDEDGESGKDEPQSEPLPDDSQSSA